MKTEQIPEEFQSVNRLFEQLAAKGEMGQLDAVYTRAARLLPPGAETVSGIESIQEFWRAAVSTMGVKSLSLKTAELEVIGDTAIELGTADLVAENVTSPTRIKYVVIWKKQDGRWRWDIDIWNAAAS